MVAEIAVYHLDLDCYLDSIIQTYLGPKSVGCKLNNIHSPLSY